MNIEITSGLTNIPIEDISYDHIERFCESQIEEDIDLDYKSAFPNDLDRTLCAFANTQGGLILIGISEEGKSRVPICPPSGIDDEPDVTRQRILNIAFDAIYPPLEPEVKIIKIPDTSKFIAFIRVSPSNLVHAVDRRSRIYIRSKDNNRGYSLASLQDMRWLLDRRESSISLRNLLIERSLSHANNPAIPFPKGLGTKEWANAPHLFISISPLYPRDPILKSRELLDLANSIDQVRSIWPNVDRKVPWQQHQWRTISNGIFIRDRGFLHSAQYIEIGVHGHLFFDFLLRKQPVKELPVPRNSDELCIYSYIILSSLDISLRYSASFYESISFRKPILIKVTLDGVLNLLLHFYWPTSRNLAAEERLSLPSPDNKIELINEELISPDLISDVDGYLHEAALSLAWAFGLGWNEDDISRWLESHYGSKSA
jgi:hypothetical protein